MENILKDIKKYINILKLCKIYTDDKEINQIINLMLYTYNIVLNRSNYIKLKILLNNMQIYLDIVKEKSNNNSDMYFLYPFLVNYNDKIIRYILNKIDKHY